MIIPTMQEECERILLEDEIRQTLINRDPKTALNLLNEYIRKGIQLIEFETWMDETDTSDS